MNAYDLYVDHIMKQCGDAFLPFLMRAKWIMASNGGDL